MLFEIWTESSAARPRTIIPFGSYPNQVVVKCLSRLTPPPIKGGDEYSEREDRQLRVNNRLAFHSVTRIPMTEYCIA